MKRALALALCALAVSDARAASFFDACGQAAGQIAVVMCQAMIVAAVCKDETDNADDEVVEDEDEASARGMAEAPPPSWSPEPGALACEVRESDDVDVPERRITHVSCADGTRARFDTVALAATRALTVTQPTDASDACRGDARLTGLDDDGDGALGANEIAGRTLLCDNDREVLSPTLLGDLAIHGPDDVVRIAGRRALAGGLTVAAPGLEDLRLPSLRSVGGALRVTRPEQLGALAFPVLASVGGDVSVTGAPNLERLGLSGLRHVGGSLTVTDNPALPQAELELLVRRLTKNGFAGPVLSGGNSAAR